MNFLWLVQWISLEVQSLLVNVQRLNKLVWR